MAKSNKKIDTTEYCCSICGTPLTEENSRENAFTCLDCESKRFKQLEEKNGTHIALFLMCGMTDLPLEPMIIPDKFVEEQDDKWKIYTDLLKEKGKLEKRGKLRGFIDGVSDLREIFGEELSQKDFANYVANEQEYIDQLEGTEEQRERWGELPLWEKVPLTSEYYDELDRRLDAKMERYKGFSIDDVLLDTFKKISKLELIEELLLSKGDVENFAKIQKSIDAIQASEQLRKKDEKPIEEMRLDAMVIALENAGLMENGELLPYDELVVALRDNFIKAKKYNYSLDVCDQVILDIQNSMRRNADLMQLIDLPEELEVVDEYGEFSAEETEQEKEAKKYAGLTKVQFEKKSTQRKTTKKAGNKNA